MPYNYTIPRGPIAAMHSSPGPCYNLPGLCGHVTQPHDPRSQHYKKPAYSFGLRTPLYAKSCSPGPVYLPSSKIYRDGMDGTPHYSMLSRRKQVTPFNTPGPASYSPEKSFPCSNQPTAPSYSIHYRTALAGKFQTPAPNAYKLPPMMGPGPIPDGTKRTCPKYTMRPKYTRGGFSEDTSKAPGPGTYDETNTSVYKNRLPHYSMAARVFPPGDSSQKPGPGAHRPEDCNTKKEYPSYTFGIKHSPYVGNPVMEPPLDD